MVYTPCWFVLVRVRRIAPRRTLVNELSQNFTVDVFRQKKEVEMKSFSEKLKDARSEAGITQAELAEKIGVSVRSVQAYEQGVKSPRQNTLIQIAKVRTTRMRARSLASLNLRATTVAL